MSVLGEYSIWKDKEKVGDNFSYLNDQIKSVDHFNIGIIRYAPRIAKNLIDGFGYGTTEFFVLRCSNIVSNELLYYIVSAEFLFERIIYVQFIQ